MKPQTPEKKMFSLGAISQAIIWDRNWNKGVGMQWQMVSQKLKFCFSVCSFISDIAV